MSNVIVLKRLKDVYTYFPKRDDIRYMFSDVSLYSSADISHSLATSNILLGYYSGTQLKNKILTDASSCIGGNTWSFSLLVKGVNAVEIDVNNYECLVNNMRGYNNIFFYRDNFFNLKDEFESNIIFYDPPWGGINYDNNNIGYYYQNEFYGVDMLASKSLYKSIPELIMFKVPCNLDISWDDWKYCNTIKFKDNRGKDIYKIVVLSDIKGEVKEEVVVNRINYKKIKYFPVRKDYQ